MKKCFLIAVYFCLCAGFVFVGCKEDGDDETAIKIENKQVLTQTAYADETNGASGVTFVTAGAWTSTITEGMAKAAKAGTSTWVSIDPNHGNAAGTYTINISLEPNNTGEDRSANIIISCNGTDITISVSQKATKEDGTVLEPDVITGRTLTALVEDGSAYNSLIDNVKALINKENDDNEYEVASGSYANGGFALNLPQNVLNDQLENITEVMPEIVTISNKNAKMGDAYIVGYKSGTQVGMFWYSNYPPDTEVSSGCYTIFVYVDADVTITGSYSEMDGEYTHEELYDASLKKGWNTLYCDFSDSPSTKTATATFTTNNPGGMKWYFYDYNNDNKSSVVKTAGSKRLVLKSLK